ncbi:HAMP domain-containing sensor histidine kinase [Neobacillus sp. PS3-34]|uniref:HAMP domain-containing sensor histidine kinase n=1 Tax=Neobacillus sp. PS3-34 TaxID=3070678 RepID=UPI0027E1F544|nr:HAMP domain-containing sensor histidine kinase [Neobacillus sp. PS3-34]WML48503.1 HAMP domain-containing sensor histidine kinase [Neobacillus sp. PS3-34]
MIDLRQIPIILGGLYYGYGPFLVVSSLLLRGLFYGFDSNFWIISPLYGALSIFLWLAHPWFLKQSPRKRILVCLSTVSIMSASVFGGFLISGHSLTELKVVGITFMIQFIGICMLSYLLEEIKQNDFFREQMVKAQKVELASHMSAAISHEVRNPLTAVQGFLQLASEDPEIQATTRRYINTAISELNAAEHVIRDYLTFAQPSLQTVEKFLVNEELNQIIKTLQPMANMNSVEIITVNTEFGYISGDRNRFRQCFLNILKNCIEAMPDGGTLKLHPYVKSNEINISVSDTGIGMTSDQVKRLGEPYYSTKGKKGTGLGLMVSFSIIQEMKGTVKINSKIGIGTEFLVTFPALS